MREGVLPGEVSGDRAERPVSGKIEGVPLKKKQGNYIPFQIKVCMQKF